MQPTVGRERRRGRWPRCDAAARAARPSTSCSSTHMMPEMDGFELADAISAEPGLAEARLMLLTSAGRPRPWPPAAASLGVAVAT